MLENWSAGRHTRGLRTGGIFSAADRKDIANSDGPELFWDLTNYDDFDDDQDAVDEFFKFEGRRHLKVSDSLADPKKYFDSRESIPFDSDASRERVTDA